MVPAIFDVATGRVVEVVDDEGKKTPLFVRKYSDTLMIQLLKAHRPAKFNPPPQVAGSYDALPYVHRLADPAMRVNAL